MLKQIFLAFSFFLIMEGTVLGESDGLQATGTGITDSFIANYGQTPLWLLSKQWGTIQDVPIRNITEIKHYQRLVLPSELSFDYGVRALLSISEKRFH